MEARETAGCLPSSCSFIRAKCSLKCSFFALVLTAWIVVFILTTLLSGENVHYSKTLNEDMTTITSTSLDTGTPSYMVATTTTKSSLAVSQSKNTPKNLTLQKSGGRNISTSHNYSPMCDRLYNTSNSLFLDVVPRRAYYDNRTLTSEKSRNLVIVITEMRDSSNVSKSVLACKLNGNFSNISIVHEDTCRWVRSHEPGHTHCTVYIHCIGFPESVIRSGSSVHIIYKRENDTCYSQVATEKPLTLMKTAGLAAGKNTVIVCSAFFGSPPYFNEWLIYQKVLGMDKVHLSVDKSFTDNATSYPFLNESLDSGFVHMEVWEDFIGNKIFYHSQMTKLQDCIMQYTGVYEFALVYDSDDFFIPVLPDKKNIHSYTERLFSPPDGVDWAVGAVRLWWRRYVCEANASVYNTFKDGNVTQSLNNMNGYWYEKYKTKTVHRLYGSDYIGVHADYHLLPKYKHVYGEKEDIYVAHIRPNDTECHRSFQNSSHEAG